MHLSKSPNNYSHTRLYYALTFLLLGVFLLFPKNSYAAVLKFNPATKSVGVNESFTVTIDINTKNEQTTATDTVVTFNPDLAEITDLTFNESVYPTNTKIIDNSAGSLKTTSTHVNPVNYVLGEKTIMTLTIKALKKGIVNFVFTCATGQTTDTNIFKTGTTEDITECANLTNGAYSIGAASGTAPTVTPTSTQAIPQSGNVRPTEFLIIGGVSLLSIGALLIFLL